MNPLTDLVLIFLLAFGVGLIKGSTACTALCLPALLSYFLEKDYTRKQTLQAVIIFNIPRVSFFILLGVIVGYLSFELADSKLVDISEYTGLVGYSIVAAIVLVLGSKLLVRALDEREDLKEGKIPACRSSTPLPSLRKQKFSQVLHRDFYNDMDGKEKKMFLVWGTFLALGCSLEFSLVEGAFFSGSVAFLADNAITAVLYGGLVMAVFGIGTALPMIVAGVASAHFRHTVSSLEQLNTVKVAGAALALLMGLFLLLKSVSGLAVLLS